jgi:hypothetical protein
MVKGNGGVSKEERQFEVYNECVQILGLKRCHMNKGLD